MKRRLLNLVTVLSLLICLAGAVLWARSYVAADTFTVQTDKLHFVIFSSGGSYLARAVYHPNSYGPRVAWKVDSRAFHYESAVRELVRFQWSRHTEEWKTIGYSVVAPQWTVPAVGIVLPAVQFLRWCRRGLRSAGKSCPECGYDLTGKSSGVCPECGAPAPPIHA